jgi:hypothetical protein
MIDEHAGEVGGGIDITNARVGGRVMGEESVEGRLQT